MGADVRAATVLLDGVTFSYHVEHGDALRIFSNYGLRIDDGDLVGIIGPSGCGKSTLLRLMAGLVEPDEGQVTLFGNRPEAMYSSRAIGVSLQDHVLVPWLSTLRNVELPADPSDRASRERALQLLAGFGLDGDMGAPASQLSGGMRARAALARSLINDPSLLLLDEPFAALDELTAVDICRRLLENRRRRAFTAVIVSHNLDAVARLAHRCICLTVPSGGNVDYDLGEFGEPAERTEAGVSAARAKMLAVYRVA